MKKILLFILFFTFYTQNAYSMVSDRYRKEAMFNLVKGLKEASCEIKGRDGDLLGGLALAHIEDIIFQCDLIISLIEEKFNQDYPLLNQDTNFVKIKSFDFYRKELIKMFLPVQPRRSIFVRLLSSLFLKKDWIEIHFLKLIHILSPKKPRECIDYEFYA